MPDFKPIGAQTQFKCAFDIDPGQLEEPMSDLRRLVRKWCTEKKGCRDESKTILQPWFYLGTHRDHGGEYQWIGGNQLRVATVPSDNPSAPSAWGLELIHADSDESARRWCAEVFLRKQENGKIRFSTIVSYWMLPNFIGEYPEQPIMSVPAYVRDILWDSNLACTKGSVPVLQEFIPVTTDNARSIYNQVADQDRGLPFVFLGGTEEEGKLAADPVQLKRYLIGNANVFAFFDPAALEEMNYYLGDQYRCEMGTVRCYQTRFDRDRIDNPKIHRFFDRTFIAERGGYHAIELLANGLAKNGACFDKDDITDLSDIYVARRRYRFRQLAAEVAEATDAADKAAKEADLYEAEKNQYFEEGIYLYDEIEELKNMVAAIEEENNVFREKQYDLSARAGQADDLRKQVEELQHISDLLPSLAEFPKSLEEVVNLIEKLFPGRLVFTDEAKQSARSCQKKDKYWQKADGCVIAWKMLVHLATTGVEAMFSEEITAKDDHFHSVSGFKLALSEGSTTKGEKQLAAMRKTIFNGVEYDISPHVKFDKKPQYLRIHFATIPETGQIIIGHCGNHLDTAGTKKMS